MHQQYKIIWQKRNKTKQKKVKMFCLGLPLLYSPAVLPSCTPLLYSPAALPSCTPLLYSPAGLNLPQQTDRLCLTDQMSTQNHIGWCTSSQMDAGSNCILYVNSDTDIVRMAFFSGGGSPLLKMNQTYLAYWQQNTGVSSNTSASATLPLTWKGPCAPLGSSFTEKCSIFVRLIIFFISSWLLTLCCYQHMDLPRVSSDSKVPYD